MLLRIVFYACTLKKETSEIRIVDFGVHQERSTMQKPMEGSQSTVNQG